MLRLAFGLLRGDAEGDLAAEFCFPPSGSVVTECCEVDVVVGDALLLGT